MLLLAACPGPPASNDPDAGVAPGQIGSACKSTSECNEGLTCIVELPGGACTKACTTSCDDTSICVQVQITTSSDPINLCAPICEQEGDCREGYQCVSVGRRSVCSI
jgi:hypothetical protein